MQGLRLGEIVDSVTADRNKSRMGPEEAPISYAPKALAAEDAGHGDGDGDAGREDDPQDIQCNPDDAHSAAESTTERLEVKIENIRLTTHQAHDDNSAQCSDANEMAHTETNARDEWPSFLLTQYSLSTRIDGAELHRKIGEARMKQHRRQDLLGTFPILALLRTKLMKFGLLLFAAYGSYQSIDSAALAAGANPEKASVVRFSILEMRGRGFPTLANVADDITLSMSSCPQPAIKVERNMTTITVWHPAPVPFDSWTYSVVGGDPGNDVVKWGVEISSNDGRSFERLQMHKSLSWEWPANPRSREEQVVEMVQRPWMLMVGYIMSYCVIALTFSTALLLLLLQNVAGARKVLAAGTALGLLVNLVWVVVLGGRFGFQLSGHHVRNAVTLGLLFPCVASPRLERHISLGFLGGGLVGLVTLLWQSGAELGLLEDGVRLVTDSAFALLGVVLMLRRRQELAGLSERTRADRRQWDAAWEQELRRVAAAPAALEAFRAALAALAAVAVSPRPVQQTSPSAADLPPANVLTPHPAGSPVVSGRGAAASVGGRRTPSSPRSGGSGMYSNGSEGVGQAGEGHAGEKKGWRVQTSRQLSPVAWRPQAGTAAARLFSTRDSHQREALAVTSLDQLYSQAYGCAVLLREKVGLWATNAGGLVPVSPQRGGRGDDEREYALYSTLCDRGEQDRVHWTPVKPWAQALEKVLYRYGGRVEKVLDVCRESLVFDSLEALTSCLSLIAADPDVKLERISNTMEINVPSASGSGFRAVVLNLRIVHPDAAYLGLDGHLAELMLLLRPIAILMSEAAHQDYLLTRTMRTMNSGPLAWTDADSASCFRSLIHRFNPPRAWDGSAGGQTQMQATAGAQRAQGSRGGGAEPRGQAGEQGGEGEGGLRGEWGARGGAGAERDPRVREGGQRGRQQQRGGGGQGEGERVGVVATFTEVVYEQWLLRVCGKAWSLEDPQRLMEEARTSQPTSVFHTCYPVTVAMTRYWFAPLLVAVALVVFSTRVAFLAQVEVAPLRARYLRFTALQLRSGFLPGLPAEAQPVPPPAWDGPLVGGFGILERQCEEELPASATAAVEGNGTVVVLALEAPRNLSGFFFRTRAAAAALDPVTFTMESSEDNVTWTLLGSSRQFVAFNFDIAWLNRTFSTPTARDAKVQVRNDVPWWYLALALLETTMINGGLVLLAVFSGMRKYSWGKPTLTWIAAGYTLLQFVRVVLVLVHRKYVVFPMSLVSGFLGALLTAMFLWKERLVFESFMVGGIGWAFIISLNRGVLYPESGIRNEGLESFVMPGVSLVLGAVLVLRRSGAWRRTVRVMEADMAEYEEAWGGVWGQPREREALHSLQKLLVRSHGHQHLLQFHARQKYRGLNGGRPQLVTSLDLLYTQAAGLAPMLLNKVKAWAAASRGQFPLRAGGACGAAESGQREYAAWSEVAGTAAEERVEWEALKQPQRAVEKLIRSYNGRAWLLLDIGRQQIAFEHAWELKQCVKTIFDDEDVRVVRSKNRLRPDYDAWRSAGYRDLNLAIQITTSATKELGLDRHVMEVQLTLLDIARLKSEAGHQRYIQFRDSRAE